MEDPKILLWIGIVVAAFLSGKLLGYASRKYDEQREHAGKASFLKELAMCRDVFDTPPPEGKLEAAWLSAVGSPEAVPSYIAACRQNYIDQLDAKDDEIRILSAKIAGQQKHIASLRADHE